MKVCNKLSMSVSMSVRSVDLIWQFIYFDTFELDSSFVWNCRARSVYERALDVDHRCIPMWLKYAEMEMK